LPQPGRQGLHDQAAGKELGGFRIIKKLGQGGMGAVFLARQLSMDRDVALKVLPQSLARDRDFVQRFVREARAAAQLSHVNIVQAIDVGHVGGYHYFAMEFVDGRDLKEVLKWDGRLPEQRALEIAQQLAGALHYAHTTAGIIHRDVKPENVLITPDGIPKLADLGLARQVVQGGTDLTRAGVAIGTPNYISPEQVRGQTDLDGRTDVYSLGATLYHLLTGDPPYLGGTPAEVMAKHLSDPVPDARAASPDVSPAAAAVVQKAMAKDRDQRYATAQAFADDVTSLLEGKMPAAAAFARTVISAGPATLRPRRRRARRSSPWPYVGAFAAVAFVALVAWLAWPSASPGSSEAGSPTYGEQERASDAERSDEKRPKKSARKKPKRRDVALTAPELPDPPRDDPPDPQSDLSEAALAHFELLSKGAKGRAAVGDYDGAICVFDGIPGEFVPLLSTKVRRAVGALHKEAAATVNAGLKAVEQLAGSDGPKKALEELAAVEALKYAPLKGKVAALRAKLEAAAKTLEVAKPRDPPPAADDAIKKLLAKNDELCRTYTQKCEELKTKAIAALKEKYTGQVERLKRELDGVAARIAAHERVLQEYLRRRGRFRSRPGIPRKFRDRGGDRVKRELEGRLSDARKEESELKKKYAKLVDYIKKKVRKASVLEGRRKAQVKLTHQAHEDALRARKPLTEEQMTAKYEAALVLKK